MTTYQLSPKFFSQYRQRMILFMGVIVLGIVSYVSAGQIAKTPSVITVIACVLVALFACISLAVILRGEFKKHRQTWSSYELTLAENSITRTQDGFERTRIFRNEVTRIIEVTDYGLTIVGTNNTQIFIPKLLENYDLLRSLLTEWRLIEVRALWRNLTLCFTIAFLPWAIIFGIARVFQNKFLSAGSLSIYVIYVILSMITLLKSSNVNRSQKRSLLISMSSFAVMIVLAIITLISV